MQHTIEDADHLGLRREELKGEIIAIFWKSRYLVGNLLHYVSAFSFGRHECGAGEILSIMLLMDSAGDPLCRCKSSM